MSAVLVMWAAALALPNIGVRPRELTQLFLVVFLNELMRYREQHAGRLWTLPIVMVLWVNVHGGFVLGLGLLGLFLIGETVDWLRSRRPFPRQLLLVGVLTVVAASINPAGPQMLFYPLTYYSQKENPSFQIVTEFQSPNFHEYLMLLFAGGIA